jgi:hypothetical protein
MSISVAELSGWLRRSAMAIPSESSMRKLLMIGLGLCALGALWKAEEEEDGVAIALSPFLAALAIETGIFLLRRHQGSLLGAVRPAYRD